MVNPASVPNRSPLRYPGGKTWLVPTLRLWISSLPSRPGLFVEPFAGGGILSLTVAFEGLADHCAMTEIDPDVSALWTAVLGEDAGWLAEQIHAFHLTRENVLSLMDGAELSSRERAFRTLVKNRVSYGGVLAPGSGLLNAGENGKGIASRWYPETLCRRILEIHAIGDRISFECGDGLGALQRFSGRADVVYLIDPPYTAAGKRAGRRLYTHHAIDHDRLFGLAGELSGDFLMTYDNAEGVRRLAERHGLDTQPVAMKNTHHACMTELLIGRNLHWSR